MACNLSWEIWCHSRAHLHKPIRIHLERYEIHLATIIQVNARKIYYRSWSLWVFNRSPWKTKYCGDKVCACYLLVQATVVFDVTIHIMSYFVDKYLFVLHLMTFLNRLFLISGRVIVKWVFVNQKKAGIKNVRHHHGNHQLQHSYSIHIWSMHVKKKYTTKFDSIWQGQNNINYITVTIRGQG